MLFNSLTFVALLVPLLTLYWGVGNKSVRLILLLAGSLLFYSHQHWPSVFLLLLSILVNYWLGRRQSKAPSRPLLWLSIAVNLCPLIGFKYSGFLAENLSGFLHWFGIQYQPSHHAFLPLGISFFTFQVIAYQVDVYRKSIDAETSLLRFAVFKSFFPQLIAGPIVRAADFLPKLRSDLRFDPAGFHQGLWLLAAGMGLKIGVADVLAQFAQNSFASPSDLTTATAWAGLYAYAFQLYADFWGYSTMAVGLALLFGLELPENFNTPYLSGGIQEFWRRWHITLSIWFRDYVYIPLGGNRRRRDLNLLITMGLAGLWHGAGWPFLIWGLAHGIWLIGEHHFRQSRIASLGRSPLWMPVRVFLVFHGVCLLWVLFRSPDLATASSYYSKLLLPPYSISKVPRLLLHSLVVFALIQWPLSWTFKDRRFTRFPIGIQCLLALLCLWAVLVYAGAKIDFIYFTF
jgi:alginate O-acetyltransferase complex protein AlgI